MTVLRNWYDVKDNQENYVQNNSNSQTFQVMLYSYSRSIEI